MHLNNNLMKKVAQLLNNNPKAKQLNTSIYQGFFAIAWGLDDLIAYGQSNGAMIQAKVFAATQRFDDLMTCK